MSSSHFRSIVDAWLACLEIAIASRLSTIAIWSRREGANSLEDNRHRAIGIQLNGNSIVEDHHAEGLRK
jgi:hypothetical protein